MKQAMLIAVHEFRAAVRRRSFAFVAVGLPTLAVAIVLLRGAIAGSGGATPTAIELPKAPLAPQGYVDNAGRITSLPEALSGAFRAYPDEEQARAATARGELDGYYVIPDDFVADGGLIYYSRDYNPLGAEARAEAFRYLITLNLTGDVELTSLLWQPVKLSEVSLEAREDAATGGAGIMWVPYALLMVLFVSLSMSSGWLLSSLTNEKDTRMLELMLSSVSPLEMMAGKAAGLGAAGLVQVAIWLFVGNLMLQVGGHSLSLPAGFSLGAAALSGSLLFFVLGYALYAAVFCGLGALAPSLRDASQVTILVYLPLMVPLWLINSIAMSPNGPLAVALSIFPFTSPIVMAARLTRVSPPAWQLALAVVLLLATAYGTMRLAARLFRAQTLLSGQPLSWARLRASLLQE